MYLPKKLKRPRLQSNHLNHQNFHKRNENSSLKKFEKLNRINYSISCRNFPTVCTRPNSYLATKIKSYYSCSFFIWHLQSIFYQGKCHVHSNMPTSEFFWKPASNHIDSFKICVNYQNLYEKIVFPRLTN